MADIRCSQVILQVEVILANLADISGSGGFRFSGSGIVDSSVEVAGSGGIKFSDSDYVVPSDNDFLAGGLDFWGSGYVPPVYPAAGGVDYFSPPSTGVPEFALDGSGNIDFAGKGTVEQKVITGSGGIDYFVPPFAGIPKFVVTGSGNIDFAGEGAVEQAKVITGSGGVKYYIAPEEGADFELTGSGGFDFLSKDANYDSTVIIGSSSIDFSTRLRVTPIPLHVVTGSGGFDFLSKDANYDNTVIIGSNNIDFSTRPRVTPIPLHSFAGSGGFDFRGEGGKAFLLTGWRGIKYSGTGGKPFLDQQDLVRQTWVFSSRFETSIFGDFNFIKLRTFKGKLYGLLSDGLYLIEGDVANDNGILLKKVDFGGAGRKRIRSIQLGQTYNRLTEIQASVDAGSEYTASYARGRYFLQHAMLGHEFDLKIKNVSSGIDKVVANVVSRS